MKDTVEAAINKVYADFEACGTIRMIDEQLRQGLVSKIEHARYVVQVWEAHKRLPQYCEVTSAFPLMF